jgi:UDP-GlcNAc:undecaprenyl-phosphate GlcNAc-1-phosphate transferase
VIAFVVGLALTILFTPLALALARRFALIDYAVPGHPGTLQTKPLPRAGGVAMYLAFVVATLLLVHPLTSTIVAILFAAGINVAIGTLDDRRSIHPLVRMGTLAISGIIVILAGVTIPFITNPFAGVTGKNFLIYLNQIAWILPMPSDLCRLAVLPSCRLLIHPLADGLALFWILWLINSLNWSKGIGGQLSGISAIAALTLGGTALMFTSGNPAQFTTATLCFILAGCALGFLPFNFPPERQLPGYGASSFLGLILAVLSMLSGAKLAAAILVLGIPTIDGIITIVRRLAQGRLPIWGDSNHLYHKLLNLGLTKRQIVSLYWLVTGLLGFLALELSGKQKIYAFVAAGVLIAAVFLTVSYLIVRQKRLAGQKA